MSETVQSKRKKKKEEKPKKPLWWEIGSWILTLGSAVVIALLIRTYLFFPVRVDGHSMENTLLDREIVVATIPEYLRGDYNRRDIVICHYPNRGSTLFVKRLVALPGDTLEIRDGVLYVNGEMVDESDVDMSSRSYTNLGPITLGEDQFFVMGDNRGNSNDSRSQAVGPLTRDQIVAHARRVVWPLSKFWDKVQ